MRWVEPLYFNSYKYYFEDVVLKENIRRFISNYVSKVDRMKAIDAHISGIKIGKMMVYSSKEKIKSLNIDGLIIN